MRAMRVVVGVLVAATPWAVSCSTQGPLPPDPPSVNPGPQSPPVGGEPIEGPGPRPEAPSPFVDAPRPPAGVSSAAIDHHDFGDADTTADSTADSAGDGRDPGTGDCADAVRSTRAGCVAGVLIAASSLAVSCGGDPPPPSYSVPSVPAPSAPMLPAQTGAEISAPAPALPEFIPGPQPTEPDPGVIVPTTPTLTSEPPSPSPEPSWPVPTPFPTPGLQGE